MHDKGQLITDRGRLWLQTAHMLHIHMGAGREEGYKLPICSISTWGQEGRKEGRTKGRKKGRKEDDKINFNLTKQLFN